MASINVYKKVVKFSFKQQKIFWVLVFGFMYLVLVDAMDYIIIYDKSDHCLPSQNGTWVKFLAFLAYEIIKRDLTKMIQAQTWPKIFK